MTSDPAAPAPELPVRQHPGDGEQDRARAHRWARLNAALEALTVVDLVAMAPLSVARWPGEDGVGGEEHFSDGRDSPAVGSHVWAVGQLAPLSCSAPSLDQRQGLHDRPSDGGSDTSSGGRQGGMHATLVQVATQSVSALEVAWLHPAGAPCCHAVLRPLWMTLDLPAVLDALPGWVGLGLGPQTPADWRWLLTQLATASRPIVDGGQMRALWRAWSASTAQTAPELEGLALSLIAQRHLLLLGEAIDGASLAGCGHLLERMRVKAPLADLAWMFLAAPRLADPRVPGSSELLQQLRLGLATDPLLAPRLASLQAPSRPLAGLDKVAVGG